MTIARLNQIFIELSQNRSLCLSRMSVDRWSWCGCSNHKSLSLTDAEITELYTGGMIVKVETPSYGWGICYAISEDYCCPAYLAESTSQPFWMNEQAARLWIYAGSKGFQKELAVSV